MSIASSGPLVQQVTNGQLVNNSTTSEAKAKTQENKDMFLQLLVAEMQYQDPLEPTDNSQYIQQLYSMSQTESILSVQEDMENLTARNMIGKYVTVQDPVTGEYIDGKVDSVADAGGGVLKISLNGQVFEVGDVKQIHDEAYFMAVSQSDALTAAVSKLPAVEHLRTQHKEDLEKAVEMYNAMDEYSKGFLSTETVNKLTDLVTQMNILIKKDGDTSKDDVEGAEGVEGTEEVENAEEAGEVINPEIPEEEATENNASAGEQTESNTDTPIE